MASTPVVAAGLVLIVAGAGIFLLQPFSSCGFYVNLLLARVCEQRITVDGLDPNLFAGLVTLALGAVVTTGGLSVR